MDTAAMALALIAGPALPAMSVSKVDFSMMVIPLPVQRACAKKLR
jgi:hypothetical protein